MNASMLSSMKALEVENRRLKHMYAEKKLKAEIAWRRSKKVVNLLYCKAMVLLGRESFMLVSVYCVESFRSARPAIVIKLKLSFPMRMH